MSLPPMPSPIAPAELAGAMQDPAWADGSCLRCVVVDLTEGVDRQLAGVIAKQVIDLPVPVIGLGACAACPLAPALDLVVDDVTALDAVLAAVDANPQAAAVLMQVLRNVGKLAVADGLVLESLAYATLQGGAEFARWLSRRGAPSRKAPPAGDDPVLLEREGARLHIVLNAPHNRNALSAPMRDALTEAFRMVQLDHTIDSIDVRGNGPCFSAGGDLTEFGSVTDPATAHEIRLRRMPARYLAARAARYHVHVHGACVGAGIELPAFAGRITATADAWFQLPEVAMGLIPGAGGCVSIPRRIGRQRTALMALTGQRVDARQALAWGLIDALG
jgi:enoyl-CoA hydratase